MKIDIVKEFKSELSKIISGLINQSFKNGSVPSALLPALSKMIESWFDKDSNTQTATCNLIIDLTDKVDKGSVLNLCEAFDMVDHNLLLSTLEDFEIRITPLKC